MKVAVLGSGNGGCALAADWALAGNEVRLFDFEQFDTNIKAIIASGGIETTGVIDGFAKLAYVGHDIEETISDVQLIFVVGPAYSTAAFGKAVKQYLRKGQIVCVCPSSCGGAIVFKNALDVPLYDEEYIISETSTLPYACRVYEPGKVHVYHKINDGIYIAAIPGKYTKKVFDMFETVHPGSSPSKSIFMTMIQTANTIIHPAVTLLNASRIESTNGDFLFYEDGATPAAGRLMKGLDTEKLAISEVLDAGLLPDIEVKILQEYNTVACYETGYSSAPGFKGIKAQSQLDHRYFNEDVGYGLVFISELGKQIKVKTPIIDAMILIVSTIMNRDYREEGALTPTTLGINHYSVEELKSVFNS
ncbi:MAG: NAD/NADP octopine/nopaline dehydrogenase family protein [Acidaminobacteraceae bacterium]